MGDASLRELATRIDAHLKRFERLALLAGLANAGCYYMGGARLRITYISRTGGTTVSRSRAIAYLDWLDAGGVGPHDVRVTPNAHATTAQLDGSRK